MPIDLSKLNKEQLSAVECVQGPLLVLAGAGSGKTRVLTYRIAHILEQNLCFPWEILAITFTNKAASEMRQRENKLLGQQSLGMWILTFHSMCVRILRKNAVEVGYGSNFTIYDDSDQKRLIKIICSELNVNTKIYSENLIRGMISAAKNELQTPEMYEGMHSDPPHQVASEVYFEYQKRLKLANAMDFDDLLLNTYLLFVNHPEILDLYQNRFKYILIDEYQDTNRAQYMISKMLAAKHHNIMVVGDDDQSIYSWRGADIRNILGFEKDYPDATVVKLQQNYRSTSNILNAANAVISNNLARKPKTLFTQLDEGPKIGIYCATTERDEGRWIAGEVEKRHLRGSSYNDIAVFYRTNVQSRVLEDMLIRAGINYKIVGGVKFFERAEIKDIMSYLTLLINPSDDVAAHRVINTPRRGLGKTTISMIDEIAHVRECSFLDACKIVALDVNVRERVRKSLFDFCELINRYQQNFMEPENKEIVPLDSKDAITLRMKVEQFIRETGIVDALEAEQTLEADARIENIDEFYGVIEEFTNTHNVDEVFYDGPDPDENEPQRVLRGDNLVDFLEWVRLRTDLDSLGSVGNTDEQGNQISSHDEEALTLMTVHSAKGLEFDYVFVAGVEEGLFPHQTSFGDNNELEEERRLAYVAITRAKKELILTCAQTRQLRGQTNANPISRFIGEIPNNLKENKGIGSQGVSGFGWDKRGDRHGVAGSGTSISYARHSSYNNSNIIDVSSSANPKRSYNKNSREGTLFGGSKKQESSRADCSKSCTYNAGDKVIHKFFGPGIVKKVDGDKLSVYFNRRRETKTLLANYAPMELVN